MDRFEYITGYYKSNCFIEAMKAKLKNWHGVKIYFCKPRITENGNFQMCHFMWTDYYHDYDFSDDQDDELPWYKCFLFKGRIRMFRYGFAEKYSNYRNMVRGKRIR